LIPVGASLVPRPEQAEGPGARDFDPELREYLRQWRSAVANQENVAAFIVMHDTSLAEICRKRPASLAEIRGVSGFGERKTERYGQQILDALERFRKGERAPALVNKNSKPAEDTIRLLAEGRSFEEIAKIRGRQLKSVIDLVAGLVEKGELQFQSAWIDDGKRANIEEACARLGMEWLKPIKEALPPEITYEEIRLVTARLRREQQRTA
jgi:ATP-dependent DNA helicase RecQ